MVWLKDYNPTLRTEAIWTVFAAFGLPHMFQDYLEWVNSLPEGLIQRADFPAKLPWSGLDRFVFWLWRGEKWSQGFWAMKVADGTMLATVLRLRELASNDA
jgi:hypothetical protein